MKYIRITALVLCIILLITVPTVSVFGASGGYDINAAMNTFSPDTVLLYSGDITAQWGLFYFLLFNEVIQLTNGFRAEVDWHEPSPDGSGTLSDLLKEYIAGQASQSLIYDYGVRELNVTLTDEDLAVLFTGLDSAIEEAGGEALFEAILRSSGFIDLATYEDILVDMALQNKLPTVLYGEGFNNISDEIVERYAEDNMFLRAKHILLSFPDASQDNFDDTKADLLVKAEGILDELNAKAGDDDFFEFFDALMFEHSEDPGSFNSPDGYLFQPMDMVPEFSIACMELDIGEVSDVVESSYGYHIILRLPLDFDNMVPTAYAQQGQNITLRQLAVLDNFQNLLALWDEQIGEIIETPEYQSLDIGEIFAWRN